jgi:hypothetical protein
MTEETVTITKEEYEQLIEDSEFLACLEMMGVDNWCGYSEAVESYKDGLDNEND